MEQENKEIFEEVGEGAEVVSEESVEIPKEVNNEIDAILEDIGFGELSDAEAKEVQLKPEDANKVFVIEKAEIRKPMLKDANGVIQPQPFNKEKPDQVGYVSKMHITFKDSVYTSILGKIRWYIKLNPKTNKKFLQPWFLTKGLDESCLNDNFVSPVSKLYYLVCKKLGKEVGKITQHEFIEYLNSGISVI